jgi:hypothetical protein
MDRASLEMDAERSEAPNDLAPLGQAGSGM